MLPVEIVYNAPGSAEPPEAVKKSATWFTVEGTLPAEFVCAPPQAWFVPPSNEGVGVDKPKLFVNISFHTGPLENRPLKYGGGGEPVA